MSNTIYTDTSQKKKKFDQTPRMSHTVDIILLLLYAHLD